MRSTRASRNVKSFLRWAGSKRQLLNQLQRHLPDDYGRYIEPFAGSACLFFRLQPPAALLGDINSELIHALRAVKRVPTLIAIELETLPKKKSLYLRLRRQDPRQLSTVPRAARFIYLNRCCFNGIYRTNRSGEFNVPYGGDRSGKLPSVETLRLCSKVLKRASLMNSDFERVLRQARRGDFVYLDPPFSVRSRRVFKEYDSSVFNANDLARLRQWMERLADLRIHFLVSYAASEEADYLKRGFSTRVVSVRRNIAGFSSGRARTAELLIYN
jgi:DNA adenine methylase